MIHKLSRVLTPRQRHHPVSQWIVAPYNRQILTLNWICIDKQKTGLLMHAENRILIFSYLTVLSKIWIKNQSLADRIQISSIS